MAQRSLPLLLPPHPPRFSLLAWSREMERETARVSPLHPSNRVNRPLQTPAGQLQTAQTSLQSRTGQLQTADSQLQDPGTSLQRLDSQLQDSETRLQTSSGQLQTVPRSLQTSTGQLQTVETRLQSSRTALQNPKTRSQKRPSPLHSSAPALQELALPWQHSMPLPQPGERASRCRGDQCHRRHTPLQKPHTASTKCAPQSPANRQATTNQEVTLNRCSWEVWGTGPR